MKYIAIYTKDLFPMDNSRIVNKEFNTEEEARGFLDNKAKEGSLDFWNPQVAEIEDNGNLIKFM